MELASLSVSFSGPQSVSDQILPILRAAPAVIAALALLLAIYYLRDALPAIAKQLTGVEAFGVKLSLSPAQAMSAAVAMARKNDRWKGVAPVADQQKALERATRERKLLEGAEILWVDDQPSNNRNESRMLSGFGAIITFACTTAEALTALSDAGLQHRPFHMIISDISRDYPAADPKAGLEMLPELASALVQLPVVFYVGELEPNAGVPVGAFGLTNRPDELL